jgi:hypothetical protein
MKPIILIFVSSLLLAGCVRSVPVEFKVTPAIFETESSFSPTAMKTEVLPHVLEIGYMGEDLLIVTVQMPGVITQNYEANVEGEIFECTRQEQFPDRLYCFGKKPEGVVNASFKLYKKENGELSVELSIEIPDHP